MKRIFANIVVILLAAVAVFFIGWIQFSIKPGECGVMVSKTGGTLKEPLLPGKFMWRWEKLLPTNVTLHKFSLEPHKSKINYSGALPGADIYSQLLPSNPDFGYDIELALSLSVKAESLPDLVSKAHVDTQEALDVFLENKANLVSEYVVNSILSNKDGQLIREKALANSAIEKIAGHFSDDLSHVVINSIELVSAKVPDMETYEKTRELYDLYKADVQESLKSKADAYAGDIYERNKSIETLEKYAELIKKYPQLKDLGTINEISKSLKALSGEGSENSIPEKVIEDKHEEN